MKNILLLLLLFSPLHAWSMCMAPPPGEPERECNDTPTTFAGLTCSGQADCLVKEKAMLEEQMADINKNYCKQDPPLEQTNSEGVKVVYFEKRDAAAALGCSLPEEKITTLIYLEGRISKIDLERLKLGPLK